MENIEKPLTWVLAIALLGYLFIVNCKCGEETSCTLNNGFNIESVNETLDVKKEIIVKIQQEDETLNLDSIVDSVLEDIDMEGGIEIDLEKETTEQ